MKGRKRLIIWVLVGAAIAAVLLAIVGLGVWAVHKAKQAQQAASNSATAKRDSRQMVHGDWPAATPAARVFRVTNWDVEVTEGSRQCGDDGRCAVDYSAELKYIFPIEDLASVSAFQVRYQLEATDGPVEATFEISAGALPRPAAGKAVARLDVPLKATVVAVVEN